MRKFLKVLSTSLLIGLGIGLAFVVGAFLYFESKAKATAQRELGAAAAGWQDSIRYFGRVPDVAGLTVPRTDSGDGAALLWDSTLRWTSPEGFALMFARVFNDSAATAADTALWALVVRDTALNRVAAFARRREWHGLDRAIAASANDSSLIALALPRIVPLAALERAVLLRGVWRIRQRNLAGARADFAAVTTIGEHVVRGEPSLLAVLGGRRVVADAMRGYERLATATRDTALATRAAAIRAWGLSRAGRYAPLLEHSPQEAVLVARDTTLVTGVRGDAMMWIALGQYTRPSFILRGMGGQRRAELIALAAGPDPVISRLAYLAMADADRLNLRERMRGF